MTPRFTVKLLKGHCKLMSLGMTNSKISKTEMLRKAGAVTGKTYKRGQFKEAVADLEQWLEENPV